MIHLLVVSLIWAFSFGLIGNALSGVDSLFVATARLGIAGLIFLPLFRVSQVPPRSMLKLIGCGAVQFGIMYVCYMKAYQYLPSHLVALFSIFTPLYIILIHDFKKRRFHLYHLFAALLSILGAAIIKARSGEQGSIWIGFILMQIAGLAFGLGQIHYRDWKRKHCHVKDHHIFALLYIGGFASALLACVAFTDWENTTLTQNQSFVIVYLGAIASGLGFFLWNRGAARAKVGTLAAFNNAVVPLAMFCSLFIFGEISQIKGDAIVRLLLGSTCIIGAVFIAEKSTDKNEA